MEADELVRQPLALIKISAPTGATHGSRGGHSVPTFRAHLESSTNTVGDVAYLGTIYIHSNSMRVKVIVRLWYQLDQIRKMVMDSIEATPCGKPQVGSPRKVSLYEVTESYFWFFFQSEFLAL